VFHLTDFHETYILMALFGDMYLVLSKVVEKFRKYGKFFICVHT